MPANAVSMHWLIFSITDWPSNSCPCGANERASQHTLCSFPQTHLVVTAQEVLEVNDIHDALLLGSGAGIPGAVGSGGRLATL